MVGCNKKTYFEDGFIKMGEHEGFCCRARTIALLRSVGHRPW